MDLSTTSKLLDLMPGNRSEYEFKHMQVEQYGSFHRQLKNVLSEKERCLASVNEKKAAIALMKYKTTLIDDDVERSLVEDINSAREVKLRREIIDLLGDIAHFDKWLDNHSVEEIEETASGFEHGEPEHWAGIMGRQSAVEILANDKVSVAVMQQMTLLPLPDYRRAVQITSQYAEFIKSTTAKAEQQLLPKTPPAAKDSATIPSATAVVAPPVHPAQAVQPIPTIVAKPAPKPVVKSSSIDDIYNSL